MTPLVKTVSTGIAGGGIPLLAAIPSKKGEQIA